MSSLLFCLIVFLITAESLIVVTIDVFSGGRPLSVQNGTITDKPGDPDWALRMEDYFGFTIGVTFLNPTTTQIYGVTSGHNLCTIPTQSLYRWKGGSSMSDERVSVAPYEYESASSDCGTFIYDTRTFLAHEFINKSGYNKDTAIDVTSWTVYDHPPRNYTVEKHGEATGYTKGYISAISLNRGIDAPKDCNASDSFFKVIYEVQMLDGSHFADQGDFGAMVYNGEDKVIIGFVVASYYEHNTGAYEYTIVVPYRFWVENCGIQSFPQYKPLPSIATSMQESTSNSYDWRSIMIIIFAGAIVMIAVGGWCIVRPNTEQIARISIKADEDQPLVEDNDF